MPWALIPRDAPEPLVERLQRLGARLRRVTALRSGSRLLAATVLAVVALGLADYRFHLPALVRALALVAILAGGLLYYLRAIRVPLRGSGDPLRMALHVESHYPHLNDALASAVEFLQMPAEDDRSSPHLRQMAIRQAVAGSRECDLDATVDGRGTTRWFVACLVAVLGGTWLLATHPAAAATALKRLAFPFAGVDWPTQAQVEIIAPKPVPGRIASGEAFELVALVRGAVPDDRAVLTVWLEGGTSFEQVYAVGRREAGGPETKLPMRIETTRLPRNFRFQVRANDGATPVYAVTVAPPPVLVPLNGRPSPQTRLDFPAYTDLPALDLPDGSTLIEAVAGTRVTIAAATDRPIARAWIAYRPEQPRFNLSAPLAPFGASHPLGALAAWTLGREVWAATPVQVSASGTELFVSFVPRVPGNYAFRFEDETGLGGTRLFDCRIVPDPVPLVSLDRPSAGKDPLLLLPDANVPVQVTATDKLFALKALALEYRTGRNEPPRTLPLGNVETIEALLPGLAGLMPGPIAIPTLTPPHVRPQAWSVERRVPLATFRHPDGRALREGDTLILQAAALDFDDVTGSKPPGRSPEVELQIVSRQHVESVMQQSQAELRAELLKLRELQRDARGKVQDALGRLRNNDRLSADELDRLMQAEQTQRQIRGRVNAPDDGLQTEVERLKENLQVNRLPRSATSERIEDIARELERLAAEELEPIEPLIAQARREQEQGSSAPGSKGPLARAEGHQREVEETLQALLERLEPWSGASEARGEARTLLGELRRAAEQTKQLGMTVPPGEDPARLTPGQRAELDRAAARQERIAERGRQFAEKLNRLADGRDNAARERQRLAEEKAVEAGHKEKLAAQEPAGSNTARALKNEADDLRAAAEQARDGAEALTREAGAIRDAIKAGNTEELKDLLRQAGPDLRSNEVGQALNRQQAAAEHLQKLIDALEEKPAAEADRLAKKAKQFAERLDGLADEQEQLQKKVEEAKQIADPEKRREALQRLARDQERLERQTRDVAQRLARNGAEEPAQDLRRAAREMDEARRQLEEGEPADAAQDEALDRIDDARDGLDEARRQQDEELLREKLAKVADQVKALRDRQLRALEEAERIHGVARRAGSWSRPLLASVIGVRDQQTGLEKETRDLAQKRFADWRVFARMLRQAADAMEEVAQRLDARREDILDQLEDRTTYQADLEAKAQAGIAAQQRLALKRLDQLLEALKPDAELMKAQAARRQQGQQQQQPMPGEPPANRPGDDIPPVAQLKALRSLQAELRERTAAFDQLHPDRSQLDDEARAELAALEKAQREVAELFEELAATAAEGDQP